jgi:hypothetical protein
MSACTDRVRRPSGWGAATQHIGAGGLSRERRSSGDWRFRVDKWAGADALRRGWIGLTMKALIGYGSDVSARVLHDLPAMRHPLGRIGISDF